MWNASSPVSIRGGYSDQDVPWGVQAEKDNPGFQRSQSHLMVEMRQILCGCHYSKSGLMMSSLVSSPLPLSFTESSFSWDPPSFLGLSLYPTPQFHGVPDPDDPSDTAICYSERCTRVSTVHPLTPPPPCPAEDHTHLLS